jgi:hypothetical protein
MIKTGIALGSGIFFVAVALYFGSKKEDFLEVKENEYKILLENIN